MEAVGDNDLFLFGGELADGVLDDTLWNFNIASRRWQKISSFWQDSSHPVGVSLHAMCVKDSMLYVFGGESLACWNNFALESFLFIAFIVLMHYRGPSFLGYAYIEKRLSQNARCSKMLALRSKGDLAYGCTVMLSAIFFSGFCGTRGGVHRRQVGLEGRE